MDNESETIESTGKAAMVGLMIGAPCVVLPTDEVGERIETSSLFAFD
jgi:hypothetical protein